MVRKFADDPLEVKHMFPVFLKSDNLKVFCNMPVKRPRLKRFQSHDFTKKMYLLRFHNRNFPGILRYFQHLCLLISLWPAAERQSSIFALTPFVPNAPFLYPLKTSEKRKVFRYFQGVEKRCTGNEWVNIKRI